MNEIVLTTQDARDIDKRARDIFGISALVLMENAGRAVAEVVLEWVGKNIPTRVAIFCGRGNNADRAYPDRNK